MTSELAIITEQSKTLATVSRIDLAIAAWLDAKGKRSGSARTLNTYRDTLADFRAALAGVGADLDADPRGVRLAAQRWAGASKSGREVTATTFNQRLAVVSSFYDYAIKYEFLETANPIQKIERRKVQGYANALPIEAADVRRKLAAIDRGTLDGKRDYALLAVALETGRRASELADLQRGDLVFSADRIIVTFRRCKGGKVMVDKLSAKASKALVEYLAAAYGSGFASIATSCPLWLSTSRRNPGKGITIQTIADICERRLGTSKIHALRHTAAHTMEKAGVKVSEIQAQLGHESLQTTGRYLAQLNRAENPHADALADMFGL